MMTAAKKSQSVEVYDTTLRDGTQAEGVAFSLDDKIAIAYKLDELGVDYIEGGYPLSNAKDEGFFAHFAKAKLRHAKIAAFGMTRRKGVKASEDVGMKALVESKAQVVTIVAKGWDMQVKKVLGVSLEENLKMVVDTVKYLKKKGCEVFLDAEHFFDGYKENPEYSVKVLEAGAEAGATRLILCDTNGGCMTEEIHQIVTTVNETMGAPTGIHVHNDCGLAVANSIEAVRCGALQVQGTINGFGERAGNADLCAIVPNLMLKMNYTGTCKKQLHKLTETSRFVYELANLNLPLNQPYVGVSCFAHKGGMHVHAINKDTRTYEHIKPEAVGNTRRILISELSGASNLLAKNEKLKLIEDRSMVRKILHKVQDLENEGYQFETAEASFDLLVRKFLGKHHTFFTLDHYRTVILKRDDEEAISEATVKMQVNDQVEHRVAEGDGPVNALDGAMRRALIPHYPVLGEMHLVDYKVRVINSKKASAAKVRVVIESSDAQEHWGTIGVSDNIIDASWQALVDSFEYKLLRAEEA